MFPRVSEGSAGVGLVSAPKRPWQRKREAVY